MSCGSPVIFASLLARDVQLCGAPPRTGTQTAREAMARSRNAKKGRRSSSTRSRSQRSASSRSSSARSGRGKGERSASGRSSRSARGRNGSGRDDAIALLKADHREVEGMFSEFESARSDDRKSELAQQICLALRTHTTIEEEIFYPAFLEATGDTEIHH